MTVRALVTGATGCVGANVVEALLARGYEVRAMRRATSKLDALAGFEPEFVTGDVTDAASLRAAMDGCAVVFHVAAISQYWRSGPDAIYRVNVGGTRNVVQAALALGVERIVVTSSVAVLGVPAARGQLLDETATFNLQPKQFPYGHSKVLAEAEVQRAVEKGLDAVIVNPAPVVGQRDVNFVGGEIVRAVKRGWFLATPPGGMGIVSAKAVGEGHVLAAERGRTGERYILSGENLPHRAFTTLVAEIVGARPPLFTVPRVLMKPATAAVDLWNSIRRAPPLISGSQMRMSVHDMYYDVGKAARELGFVSAPAREAVVEAWDWYREHGLL